MRVSRFHTLDICRGLAALAVAAGHFIIDGTVPVNGEIPQAEKISVIWNFSFIYAVDFFLVLSGFILAHSYFHRMEVSLKDFALRRFFRMYPLHLLMLIITLLIFVVFDLPLVPKDVALHFLFLQNLGFGPEGITLNAPAWTISVEFWVNIGVFLLILMVPAHSPRALIGFALIALVCYVLVWWGTGYLNVQSENYKGILNAGLLRCLGAFLLGVIAYELYLTFKGWRPDLWMVLVSFLMFLAIVLVLPGHLMIGFLAPFVFAVIIFVLACAEAMTMNFTRVFSYLGDVSFSVYLVHHPLLRLFRETDIEKTVLLRLSVPSGDLLHCNRHIPLF